MSVFRRFPLLLLVAWVTTTVQAQASLELPPVFGDHMVLQREARVPVWGRGEPGAGVTVRLDRMAEEATVGGDGQWQVTLPTMPAGGPYVLTVASGTDSLHLRDVYVGEVWLCSGQSNMEWSLAQSAEGADEIPVADRPQLRFFHLKKQHDTYRTPYTEDQREAFAAGRFFGPPHWELSSPETAASFSAVAYFFGRELRDSLDVAVGLIQAAVGGSPAQSWISREALAAHPQLSQLVASDSSWLESRIIHPWLAERARQNWEELSWPRESPPPHPFAPTYLYQTAIQPLLPFRLGGVIWYQGESNATHPESYAALQATLIRDWRRGFEQPRLPFLYVQLPKIGNRSRWAEFRQAQATSLSLPRTGMVVALDQGHPTDVHPREKRVIGERLARLALSTVHGWSIPAESPRLTTHTWLPGENTIRIRFARTYDGLQISDAKQSRHSGPGGVTQPGGLRSSVEGFTLQGFTDHGGREVIIPPSNVILDGDSVTLTYPPDFLPVTVKYGWAPYPTHNLTNSAGLPVAPFKIELPGTN